MRSGASAPQTPASIYLNAARVHSLPPAARTHAQGSALSSSSGATRPAAPAVRAALTPPAPARLWGLGELIAGFSPKVAVVGDRELEAGARLALLREDVDARRLDGLCRAVQGCSPQVPPPSATARAGRKAGAGWTGGAGAQGDDPSVMRARARRSAAASSRARGRAGGSGPAGRRIQLAVRLQSNSDRNGYKAICCYDGDRNSSK